MNHRGVFVSDWLGSFGLLVIGCFMSAEEITSTQGQKRKRDEDDDEDDDDEDE